PVKRLEATPGIKGDSLYVPGGPAGKKQIRILRADADDEVIEALRAAARGAEVRRTGLLDPICGGPAARVGSFPQTKQPSPVGLGDNRKESVRSGARKINVDAADIRSGERIRSGANHSRPGSAVVGGAIDPRKRRVARCAKRRVDHTTASRMKHNRRACGAGQPRDRYGPVVASVSCGINSGLRGRA